MANDDYTDEEPAMLHVARAALAELIPDIVIYPNKISAPAVVGGVMQYTEAERRYIRKAFHMAHTAAGHDILPFEMTDGILCRTCEIRSRLLQARIRQQQERGTQ